VNALVPHVEKSFNNLSPVDVGLRYAQHQPTIKNLGRQPYQPIFEQMQHFTQMRDENTPDEIWWVEHAPVYTLGQKTDASHHPRFENNIPLVQIDRGGQITYHGPGQLVCYLLWDLNRLRLSVRSLVRGIETIIVDWLAHSAISATGSVEAPGVYVEGAKLAAIGLRVRKGRCYHGFALNVKMDLSPFAAINPCGYPGMAVAQLDDLGIHVSMQTIQNELTAALLKRFYP